MVKEAVADVQTRQIDEFLAEFRDFDASIEKKRLEIYKSRLQELQRHMTSEMFSSPKTPGKYTRAFWKLKEDIKKLSNKIHRFEKNEDMMNSFIRSHKKYVFEKHGIYV